MTMENPKTEKFLNPELFIRDHLAGHRTELANRRTLLAYIRTCLSMLAAGLVFIKFWQHPIVVTLGWVLLPISGLILIQGIRTYAKVRKVIRSEEAKTGETREPPARRQGKKH